MLYSLTQSRGTWLILDLKRDFMCVCQSSSNTSSIVHTLNLRSFKGINVTVKDGMSCTVTNSVYLELSTIITMIIMSCNQYSIGVPLCLIFSDVETLVWVSLCP